MTWQLTWRLIQLFAPAPSLAASNRAKRGAWEFVLRLLESASLDILLFTLRRMAGMPFMGKFRRLFTSVSYLQRQRLPGISHLRASSVYAACVHVRLLTKP